MAFFVAPHIQAPEHAVTALAGVCAGSDRQLRLQLLGRDKPLDGLRIFIGHAGWAPGQLESEIAEGAWSLERAGADAIFNGKSEQPRPPQHPKSST